MATNPDLHKFRLGMTSIHRIRARKVDTEAGKTDIAGMEAKIATLAAHVEHIRTDVGRLADVPERLGRMEEKVEHLPSKDYLGDRLNKLLRNVGIMTAVIVGVAGLALKFL